MSEEVKTEATEAAVETTAPKAKAPKAPKKAVKKAPKVGKPKAKAAKKVVKTGEKKAAKDDARQVAAASDGRLNIDQVRIVRSLKLGTAVTRDDLKELVGIGRDGKYSGKWLTSLVELSEKKPPYLKITTPEAQEGERGGRRFHEVTAAGKAALASAEGKVE